MSLIFLQWLLCFQNTQSKLPDQLGEKCFEIAIQKLDLTPQFCWLLFNGEVSSRLSGDFETHFFSYPKILEYEKSEKRQKFSLHNLNSKYQQLIWPKKGDTDCQFREIVEGELWSVGATEGNYYCLLFFAKYNVNELCFVSYQDTISAKLLAIKLDKSFRMVKTEILYTFGEDHFRDP